MPIQKINLTVDQAAEASGLGRTTLFGLIASCELESIKVGRRRLIPVTALDAYMERLRSEQNERPARRNPLADAVEELSDDQLRRVVALLGLRQLPEQERGAVVDSGGAAA
ncbi:excisionase family DNA-binding protein [Streptomyces sp. NPDC087440]|uniref:excisionase family DNA-binding protein n=1 Tax=Streptomyces sp. NPDC087440 TaxID=3365790 RepID=UPI00381000EB